MAAADEFRDKNFSIWKTRDEKPVSVAEMILFRNISSWSLILPGVGPLLRLRKVLPPQFHEQLGIVRDTFGV